MLPARMMVAAFLVRPCHRPKVWAPIHFTRTHKAFGGKAMRAAVDGVALLKWVVLA
jgi:hypothetical protein